MKQFLFMLFFLSSVVFADTIHDRYHFVSEQHRIWFYELLYELRCPKCQNNNLADSNAPIALAMQQKIYQLLQDGKNKKQIINYLTERYGESVTYHPPLKASTLILWLGPLFILLSGCCAIFIHIYRSRRVKIKT